MSMKVLIATDGSGCSNAALDEIARRTWPEGTRLRVVTAVDPAPTHLVGVWTIAAPFDEQVRSELLNRARADLAAAVRRLTEGGIAPEQVEWELLEGDPKSVVVADAEAWGADVIVVGSHGYTGVERLLLGSVSRSIAAHAKCSVEIVRCAPKSGS